MSQRIWIVSELYYPEDTSTGYFMTGIAEGLARGYSVNVLCGQPTYSRRGTRAPAAEQRHGVDIRRCFGTTLNKDILPFRLINLMTISFSVFFNVLWRIGKNDAALVVTNPPLLPFLVNRACRLKGAKCLLLINDVYPEVLIAAGMTRPTSLIARVTGWRTGCLYRSVARIIVLGRDMAFLVERKMGKADKKTVIIPNWADLALVALRKRAANALLDELKIKDRFVIQYAGNIGRTHGLKTLGQAAQKLADRKEIHFLFIGSGAKKKWLEEFIRFSGLRNVTVMGYRPREYISDSLNACDVAVISFVEGMAGISVPSRMYNIMAAGKPIIAVADDESELALVVREEQIGWVVPPGDVERLVAVIEEARLDSVRLAEMGRRARRAAETKYSYERVIAAYFDLFRGLGSSGVTVQGSVLRIANKIAVKIRACYWC